MQTSLSSPTVLCDVPAGTASQTLKRNDLVDALRGLAAVSVVLLHARSMLWVGLRRISAVGSHLDVVLGYLSAPLTFGFLGVQMLFVLSGYCIHRRGARALAADKDARLSVASYFWRRFFRIYPVYVVALLMTWLVDAYIRQSGATAPGSDLSIRTLLFNIASLQGIAAPVFGSNGVFWTLSIEIHLYLVYPLLFAASRRFGPRSVIVGTLLVSGLYSCALQMLHLNRYFPFSNAGHPVFLLYWFTWACGFYIAEVEAGRGRLPGALYPAAGCAGLVGAILYLRHIMLFTELFWAVAFSAILAYTLQSGLPSFRTPARLLSWTGLFSYSLYAIHLPIIHLLQAIIMPQGVSFSSLFPTFGALLLCVAGAWLFFQLVECWSLNLRPFERTT